MLVNAEVLHQYEAHDTNGLAPSFIWTFAKCPRCESPFVAVSEEDIPAGWQAPQRVFPAYESDRLGDAVPKPIQASFAEARQCLRAKAYTAAALMCRKTLEGICVAHEETTGNLAVRLQRLRDSGVIDRRLFEWADELRIFGNEAAHDVNVTIPSQDANDILLHARAHRVCLHIP
jgi:hypothetical protein